METTQTQHHDADANPQSAALEWTVALVRHSDPRFVGNRAALCAGAEELLGRESTLLGAGVLNDPRVSRRHAQLSVSGGGTVSVEDLGSRNGTFVNGDRVTSADLREGDVLAVGGVVLLLLRRPVSYPIPSHPRLIGRSAPMAALLREIRQVAPQSSTVLVQGETGTGKELVAREIHAASGRRGQFCALNCGGLSDTLLASELFGHVRGAFSGAERDRPGLFEEANGGTLFLDEVGDASAALQVSLLRAIQEGEIRRVGSNRSVNVDVRIVSATHVPLKEKVESGEFREDLYARLNRWGIRVPPLRERLEDIPALVSHFTRRLAGEPIPPALSLIVALLRYPWPRNIRELEAVIERATIESDGQSLELSASVQQVLTKESPTRTAEAGDKGAKPPTGGREGSSSGRSDSSIRRAAAVKPTPDALSNHLTAVDGNIRAAAKRLGVSRNTLYRWMKEAGIDPAEYRNA